METSPQKPNFIINELTFDDFNLIMKEMTKKFKEKIK